MTLAQRLALLKGKHPSGDSLFDKGAQRGDETGPAVTQPHVPLVPLSDRLQRLGGTSGGSRNIANRPGRTRRSDAEVARQLQGKVIAPGLIQVDQTIPLASQHGKMAFSILSGISFAALGLPDATPFERLLFLDTETTGLAGGTGTLPFMVCLARIRENNLQLGQWLLTGFAGEAAMLRAIFEWIESAENLVTYNGKSFDVPLLITRYRLARQPDPFSNKSAGKDASRGACKGHADLLH
ncbi:MAG: ribonuclease H-like domain-containing protein, partial [Nitrosospira sp.]